MIAPSTRSLHCLSAFRAFPATMAETQTSLTVHRSSLPFGVQGVPRSEEHRVFLNYPFGVFIAFRRSGRSPQLSSQNYTPRLNPVFIAFRRSGRSPLGSYVCTETVFVLEVFIAFRRSGRSPQRYEYPHDKWHSCVFIAFRRSGRSPQNVR